MFSLLRVFKVNFTCRIKYKQGNQLLMPGVDKLVDELYPLKYITGINQHFRIINKSLGLQETKTIFPDADTAAMRQLHGTARGLPRAADP